MLTFPREFLAHLSCCAVVMVCQCAAGHVPPPEGPTYEWVDAFKLNVSWKKPVGLPDGCEVQYKYALVKNGKNVRESVVCTPWRNFTDTRLTEETGSDGWTYAIWTVGSSSCNSSNKSAHVTINIPRKAKAKVVKDFKCFIFPSELNCTWIPERPPLHLTLSYRVCGPGDGHRNGLKVCDQPYSSGPRGSCSLKAAAEDDICILVESEAGMSTFRPVLVVPPPELSIRKAENHLKLKWTAPAVRSNCTWIYEVRYKKCNGPEVLRNFTIKHGEHAGQVSYDKRCQYEIQSKVRTDIYCKEIFSDFGAVVTYGTNEPPDGRLIVVAIVVPIILSFCVILSCYCFRRHRAIICPIVPDPSAIFKEMMMNGNNEVTTTTGSLYTPVPEAIEPCKITLVTKNAGVQQYS